jgi:hypothetical protein
MLLSLGLLSAIRVLLAKSLLWLGLPSALTAMQVATVQVESPVALTVPKGTFQPRLVAELA